MNIEELSDAELDEAIAVEVMGWRQSRTCESFPCWKNSAGVVQWLADDWAPTNEASNTTQHVLLKALGDGYVIGMHRPEPDYHVVAGRDGQAREDGTGTAPTLPDALCRAILQAYREGR
jgi:hypothetical protein